MLGPGSLIFLVLGVVVFVALSVQEGSHKRHVESPIEADPEPIWVGLRPLGLDGLGLVAAIALFVLAAHFLLALGGGHR